MLEVKKERLFYLDFIRALSMIMIVVFHFNVSLGGHHVGIIKIFPDTYTNTNLGRIGVSLFFIISGVALMFSYQNVLSIKTYFKKRFIAIYPMFWIAYAAVFLYYFYKYYTINPFSPPAAKWTFVLSIIGMDGYYVSQIPNYYLVGEWFLGCIIFIYLLFPVLRILMIKYPVILGIATIIYYFCVVNLYPFSTPIDMNFLARLPEFLFGMYFVQYIKKVNIYTFAAAMIINIFFFVKPIPILYMYNITITGISLFFALTFIGQYMKNQKVNAIFSTISKYSFVVFLIHHVTMEQIVDRFTNKVTTPVETYCLFLITCIFIAIISRLLFRVNGKLSEKFNLK